MRKFRSNLTALMAAMLVLLLLLLVMETAQAADWPTLPDHRITEGGTVRGITVQKICSTRWGTDSRHVTEAMKRTVIEEYGFNVRSCPLTLYRGKRIHRAEIDHLISRELGGADEIGNLWPQCYEVINKHKAEQADGAYKKDRLENKLHKLVCAAKPADRAALLSEYQRKIAQDWILLYHEIFGAD